MGVSGDRCLRLSWGSQSSRAEASLILPDCQAEDEDLTEAQQAAIMKAGRERARRERLNDRCDLILWTAVCRHTTVNRTAS
jgi:hypothetical protein